MYACVYICIYICTCVYIYVRPRRQATLRPRRSRMHNMPMHACALSDIGAGTVGGGEAGGGGERADATVVLGLTVGAPAGIDWGGSAAARKTAAA